MKSSETTSSRRTQARVHRNDARIAHVALARASERGWPGLRVAAIASDGGLSHRTVQQRYPTRAAIAVGIWGEASNALFAALEQLIAAGDAVPTGGDPSDVVEALNGFEPRGAERAAPLRAAGEVLIAAGYEPTIREAVAGSLGDRLHAWCATDEARAGARGFLLAAAFGQLLLGRDSSDVNRAWRRVAEALARGGAPAPAPAPAPWRDVTDFGTGDARHDALLRATLDEVAARGVHDATVAAISERLGLTQGFLFGRYGTKQELFGDAAQRDAARVGLARAERIRAYRGAHDDGIAAALDLRERAHPSGERRRRLDLEWIRYGWHEAAFQAATLEGRTAFIGDAWPAREGEEPAEAQARQRALLTLDHGVALLSGMIPNVDALAFEVVTVPWLTLKPEAATPPSA